MCILPLVVYGPLAECESTVGDMLVGSDSLPYTWKDALLCYREIMVVLKIAWWEYFVSSSASGEEKGHLFSPFGETPINYGHQVSISYLISS